MQRFQKIFIIFSPFTAVRIFQLRTVAGNFEKSQHLKMDTLLIILAMLCTLGGIAGCILPVLPGPPLSFLALLLMRWSGHPGFDSRFLWIWAGVTLAVSVLDYLLPGYLARRFGGSKYAATGSTVGMIVGLLFFPPAGLIVGAFAGALIGELLHDRDDLRKAVRVAVSSFVAFLLSTGLKLAASLAMGYYVIRALFV